MIKSIPEVLADVFMFYVAIYCGAWIAARGWYKGRPQQTTVQTGEVNLRIVSNKPTPKEEA